MAQHFVEFIGKDGVLGWFDSNAEFPFFSVWLGNNLSFQFRGEDMNEARDTLERNLIAAEQQRNSNKYTLKVHKDLNADGFIDGKTPVFCSTTFKVYDKSTEQQYQPANVSPYQSAILEKLNGIESRLAIQEARLEADDLDEEDEQNNIQSNSGDALAGLLSNPMVKDILIALGTRLLGGNSVKQPTALAGVPTEQQQKIDAAIQILSEKNPYLGDDLLKLADIAVNQPGQFDFLLSMLRK